MEQAWTLSGAFSQDFCATGAKDRQFVSLILTPVASLVPVVNDWQ